LDYVITELFVSATPFNVHSLTTTEDVEDSPISPYNMPRYFLWRLNLKHLKCKLVV